MLELHGSSSVSPAAPRRLGPYRLGPEIANGGMASVHLGCLDGAHGFGRLVAIKRIHPHLAREREFVEMFLDEARIAARISHPFVAAVTDFGEWQGQPFITMELLLGEPISRLLAAVAKQPSELAAPHYRLIVTRLMANLCEGLHAAHEVKDEAGMSLGVVHRDISPTNLLVLYSGTPKILDFGIARAHNRLHHTAPGSFKGKLGYAAPEVLMAQPYDRRSDIWSMGVVLWEMLTASRLFWGETDPERIVAVTRGRIPPPTERQPSIPPELEEVIMMALARDPAQRYQTARAMSRDLERFLGHWGDSVPHADVADWMATLFPGAVERKNELLRRSFAPLSEPDTLEADGPKTDRHPVTLITSLEPTAQERLEPEPSEPTAAPVSPPAPEAGRLRRLPSRRARPFVYALVGLCGATALVVAVQIGPTPQAGAPAVAETQRPLVPPPPVPPPAPPPKLVLAADPPPEVPTKRARRPGGATRSSPPAAAAAPAGPAKGQLLVRTPGGPAEVFYKGRRLTRTPALLTFQAGQHELQIRQLGQATLVPITVTVRADETVVYDVRAGGAP